MKGPEKSRADSAAQSREIYKNNLEKSRDDSAARSCDHRHRNRGVRGPYPTIFCYVAIKELTVIRLISNY